jgi:hypothetical protein
MKGASDNPLPVVETMLAACCSDEVDFFFIDHGHGKAICLYPTSEDGYAAEHAVLIPDGSDPFVQASIIGLVRAHNLHFADQTQAAAAKFIRTCTADYYFGFGFGEEA